MSHFKVIALVAEPTRVRRTLLPALLDFIRDSPDLGALLHSVATTTTDQFLAGQHPRLFNSVPNISQFKIIADAGLFACHTSAGDVRNGIKRGDVELFLMTGHVIVLVSPEEAEQLKRGEFADQLEIIGVTMDGEARREALAESPHMAPLYEVEEAVRDYIRDEIDEERRFFAENNRGDVITLVLFLSEIGVINIEQDMADRLTTDALRIPVLRWEVEVTYPEDDPIE